MATLYGWCLSGELQRVIDYAINPQKTDGKTLVAYKNHSGILPEAMGLEWQLQRELAGKADVKVTGYHFIHSFHKGEITHEKALEVSRELAERMTDGKCEYVIGCHTDKDHVHSHIIVNSMMYDSKKVWKVFWKKDLKIFREMSDAICREKGLSVLERTNGRGRHYYEWKVSQTGDSEKEIVRKTLEHLIPRVKDYNELKACLQVAGFQVEDQLDAEIPETFAFTVNKKLFCDEPKIDGFDVVRIPSSKRRMMMPQACGEMISDQTRSYKIASDAEISVIREDGSTTKYSMAMLQGYWEDKTVKGREGLRICPPGYTKMVRTKGIAKNEMGEGYSLEDVLQRIEENGRYISDPDILNLLRSGSEKHACNMIYDRADVQIRWKDSHLYKSIAQQRFYHWKAAQIQKRLNALSYDELLIKDRNNLPILKDRYSKLLKTMDHLTENLKEAEDAYMEMQKERFEADVIITDAEMEEFVVKKIKPLQEARSIAKEKMHLYKKRNEAAEIKKERKR